MGFEQYLERLRNNDTTLTSLYLRNNDLKGDGLHRLAEVLKTNTALNCLDLSRCKLTAEGARNLVQALAMNTTLHDLKLSGNLLKNTFDFFLKVSRSSDDAKAEFILGSLYHMRRGAPPVDKWTELTSTDKIKKSKYFRQGYVMVNYPYEIKALECYKIAAMEGFIIAHKGLENFRNSSGPFTLFHNAYLYLHRPPKENKLLVAMKLLEEAAADEKTGIHPVAILALAFLYQTSYMGLPADAEKAKRLLKQLKRHNWEKLKNTLEQLILFYGKGFFYALLGFFHECRSSKNRDEILTAATYYKQAMEYEVVNFSVQIALKERVEPAIKAYRFLQLVAQQAHQQRQQIVYQELDSALHRQIQSLSETDELDQLLETVTDCGLFEILKAQPQPRYQQLKSIISSLQHTRILLQQRVYAYSIVMSAIEKYHQQQHQEHSFLKEFRRSSPLTTREACFTYFWQHIVPAQHLSLTQLLKLEFLSEAQKKILSQLLIFLKKAQAIKKNLTSPPVLIHEGIQGTRVLKPQFATRLFPEDELVSEAEHGSHPVIILEGVHYKAHTELSLMGIAPGIEYMVDRLNKLLAGHGSAPTTLLKVTQGKRALIYQASKTVTGANLQYILEHKPEYLHYLDLNNFSAMTILGILTNPQDGKADNYMVEIEAEHDKKHEYYTNQIKALHIVGIDNDMAFGSSAQCIHYSDGGEEFTNEVRNVLFLFPQMDEPLGTQFREQFLERSPELLLIEWLNALSERNAGYKRLLAQGVFTQADFSGRDASDPGLQLPIILPSGLVRDIYRKLMKLQEYARQYANATHQELLAHVEPIVAQQYGRARDKFPDLIEGIHHIYRTSLGEDLKSRLNQSIDDFHTVASQLIYESTPRRKRELTIAEAAEELILNIHWSDLNEAQQQMLLQALDPMTLASPTELLHQLMTQTNTTSDLVLFLLNHGAQLGPVPELHGYHALHRAVRTYSLELVSLLLQQGALINGLDEAREMPLDKLLKEENLEKIDDRMALIELLLSHGAQASPTYQPLLGEILEKIKTAKAQVQSSNIIEEQPIAPPPHLQLLSPPPLPRHSMPRQQSQYLKHSF